MKNKILMVLALLAFFAAGCTTVLNVTSPSSSTNLGEGDGSIEFIVKDADTQAAIEGASIIMSGKTGKTDQSGMCTFEGVATGTQSFSAEKTGYTKYDATVDIKSKTKIQKFVPLKKVSTTTGGKITFIISDKTSSLSIANATVNITGLSQLVTNSNGICTFESVSAGTQYYSIYKDQYKPANGNIIVSEGSNITQSVTLEPFPSTTFGKVIFIVKDKDSSAPISGALVTLIINSQITDSTGMCTFESVPLGEQVYTVTKSGYEIDPAGPGKITVTEGPTTPPKTALMRSTSGGIPFYAWTREIETAAFGVKYRHASLSFKKDGVDSIWLIGGAKDSSFLYSTAIWYSSDGRSWKRPDNQTQAPFGERNLHEALVYKNKMYVIGGYISAYTNATNEIWSSSDGSNWTMKYGGFSSRYGHSAFSMEPMADRLYVIGGHDSSGLKNDIWWSTDGITWNEETPNPQDMFTTREDHTAVWFKNAIWVIGGRTASGATNDIYASADGKLWSKMTPTSTSIFSKRYGHACVIYKNKMWIIGGLEEKYDSSSQQTISTTKSDIWYSENGYDWIKAIEEAFPNGARFYHSATSLSDNKLFVIGGVNYNSDKIYEDVWSTQ